MWANQRLTTQGLSIDAAEEKRRREKRWVGMQRRCASWQMRLDSWQLFLHCSAGCGALPSPLVPTLPCWPSLYRSPLTPSERNWTTLLLIRAAEVRAHKSHLPRSWSLRVQPTGSKVQLSLSSEEDKLLFPPFQVKYLLLLGLHSNKDWKKDAGTWWGFLSCAR